MSILGRIFRRGSSEDEAPDMAGPLRLAPGDRVAYYQNWYSVVWVAAVTEGGESRHQYHLQDERGAAFVLVAEVDGDMVLTLQTPTERTLTPPEEGEPLKLGAARLEPTHRGEAKVIATGEVPGHVVDTFLHREFEDEDEEVLVVFENWGVHEEVRTGEYVHEGELAFERATDESYDPKPPPRVDAEAMREARNNAPKPKKHGTKTRAELAAIREKLRERMGDPSISP